MAAIPFVIFFSGKRTPLSFPGISGNLILMPPAGNLYIFEPMPMARRALLTNWLNPIIIQNYYILCSWGWGCSIQLAKARPKADCGSDHELFIVKFRLKLKKVAIKESRPFRYDLNQIPYYYTEKETDIFKGLDLVDRVPEELWMEVLTLYRRWWPKQPPRNRNATRQNVVWGGLTNSWEKKRS